MENFAKQNGCFYKHHNHDLGLFYASCNTENSILSVNGRVPDFSKLPRRYRGSHFIRDPRDLLVSGYNYHRWCNNEPWATRQPMSDNLRNFFRSDDSLKPFLDIENESRSYQKILLDLPEEQGYILEMRYLEISLKPMQDWNYNNPNILEMRYEEIFGNEVEKFSELYDFYRLPRCKFDCFIEIVKHYRFDSLSNRNQTGLKRHASTGTPGQWKTALSEKIYGLFMERHESLVKMLGYET